MPDDATKVRLAVRWWVVALVTLAGLVAIGAPYKLRGEFGTWQEITTATLTNVGTALLLAALLFFIERAFVRRVGEVARAEAETVVHRETANLRAANQDLAARIDDLQRLVEKRETEDKVRVADLGRTLRESVTFDSVTDLLEAAWDLRALVHGEVTVPAGGLEAPRVHFYWGEPRRLQVNELHSPPYVEVGLRVDRSAPGRVGTPVVEVQWNEGMGAVETLHALRQQARAAGLVAEAEALDVDALFMNLSLAILTAIEARRDPNSWLKGALCEWVCEAWAITDAGVVNEEHGVVVSADHFPEPHTFERQQFRPPKAPAWADERTWDVAIDIARRHLPVDRGPIAMSSPFTPYGTSNSPRRRSPSDP